MGTHPNALLLLALTPDGLARKTYRTILANVGVKDIEDNIMIAGETYHHMVMEENYDEGLQISAKEGDIVLWDCVTYGYGERIAWAKLEAQKRALQEWAEKICEWHHCTYEIFVSANYW